LTYALLNEVIVVAIGRTTHRRDNRVV